MRTPPAKANWRRRPRGPAVVWTAAALFAGIFVLRQAVENPAEGIAFLYVLPVALIAVEFGALAGVAAAGFALALTLIWAELSDVEIGPGGYLVRIVALGVTGAAVGDLASRRRSLQDEADRWFEMSNGLLAVASLDGRFLRLNAAWEQALGFRREEMLDQAYIDLVHPDDVEATRAAAAGLRERNQVVDFENRYRTSSGGWRWLQWDSRSDGRFIYAMAKDITDRKEVEAERDRLMAELERVARTDELTGLPNRRAWDEQLVREVARSARHGHPLCVVMLDFDHFKNYNDTHGHPAGDALMRETADAWRALLRDSDFIARYGGEEFAALLPELRPEEAAPGIVERLRAAVPAGQTCSAGVAVWDGHESPEAVVARADEALYAAKRAGRNRVVVADAEDAI